MPITIRYDQDAGLSGMMAYHAGAGMAKREDAARQQAMAFQAQEAARQRQHALDAMSYNAELQAEAAKQRVKEQLGMQREMFELKDEYEQKEIGRRRAEYLGKKKSIEEEFAKGTITQEQHDDGMRQLNDRYSQGGWDVTVPFFGDKEKNPTMKIGDYDVPMAKDRDGNVDPFTTWERGQRVRIEAERTAQMKAENDQKRIMDLQKSKIDLQVKTTLERVKLEADLRGKTRMTLNGEVPLYSPAEIQQILSDAFKETDAAIARIDQDIQSAVAQTSAGKQQVAGDKVLGGVPTGGRDQEGPPEGWTPPPEQAGMAPVQGAVSLPPAAPAAAPKVPAPAPARAQITPANLVPTAVDYARSALRRTSPDELDKEIMSIHAKEIEGKGREEADIILDEGRRKVDAFVAGYQKNKASGNEKNYLSALETKAAFGDRDARLALAYIDKRLPYVENERAKLMGKVEEHISKFDAAGDETESINYVRDLAAKARAGDEAARAALTAIKKRQTAATR